jgi:hypothetical protein
LHLIITRQIGLYLAYQDRLDGIMKTKNFAQQACIGPGCILFLDYKGEKRPSLSEKCRPPYSTSSGQDEWKDPRCPLDGGSYPHPIVVLRVTNCSEGNDTSIDVTFAKVRLLPSRKVGDANFP